MFDTPAPDITTSKNLSVMFKSRGGVEVLSVLFKPGHRKTLPKMSESNRSVVDFSADLQDPVFDVSVVAHEIFDEDKLWNLRDLRPKRVVRLLLYSGFERSIEPKTYRIPPIFCMLKG